MTRSRSKASGWWHRVYSRLWIDPKFQRLSEGERLFVLYALSGPQMTRIGLCRFSVGSAAEDLNIDLSLVRQRLQVACTVFGWQYDPDARVLWIPRWWKWNPPTLVKNFKGYLGDLHDVPDSPLVDAFIANVVDLPDHVRDVFRDWTASRKRTVIGTAMPSVIGTAMPSVIGTAMPTRMPSDPDPDPETDPAFFSPVKNTGHTPSAERPDSADNARVARGTR